MFVSFEGGEGSGKTTCSRVLLDWIQEYHKQKVVWTKEPGGTELGKVLRGLALNPKIENLNETTELLLMLADRAQHISEFIKPNLKEDYIVLCDRFIDSTMVYQGLTNKVISIDDLKFLNDKVLSFAYPDLTFFYKVDPEIGLKRAKERNEETGNTECKYDNKELNYHKKLNKNYEMWFKHQKETTERNIITIDGNQPQAVVITETTKQFDIFYKKIKKEN